MMLDRFRPGPVGLALEIASMPAAFLSLACGLDELTEQSPRGDGHTVMVLPGFTANDVTTLPLRSFLDDLGYETAGWNLGVNLGIKPEDEPRLEEHVERLASDGPITVIGWSLGGVFAREIARRRPELVRRVITLATPIRSREGAEWIVRVFSLLNPAAEEDLSEDGVLSHSMPLEVPMTAVWSRRDGVVSGYSCRVREEDEGPDAENIEVDAMHIGMGYDLDVLRVLAERLGKDALVHQRAG